MQEIHQFNNSYDRQKLYVKEMDKYFSKFFNIEEVNIEGEKNGVDRVFTNSEGDKFAVEYKTDFGYKKSGNAFIEIYSDYDNKRLGWAYTTKSKYVFYYFADWRIYILITEKVKKLLKLWEENYDVGYAKNKSRNGIFYQSQGIKLPIKELKTVTKKIYEKDGEQWKPYTP